MDNSFILFCDGICGATGVIGDDAKDDEQDEEDEDDDVGDDEDDVDADVGVGVDNKAGVVDVAVVELDDEDTADVGDEPVDEGDSDGVDGKMATVGVLIDNEVVVDEDIGFNDVASGAVNSCLVIVISDGAVAAEEVSSFGSI